MTGTPSVSVVIPTRDRPERLLRCLDAVRVTLRPGDEVIVVDSASTGPQTGIVARERGASVVRLEQPGASRARNAGWRAARHPLVAFTDDDCLPGPGWPGALAAAAADGIDFVTGRTCAPEPVDRPVAVKTSLTAELLTVASAEPLGASNNLLVRRSALERIGGFDERLGPGTWPAAAEDLALFDRLLAAGCTGRYEPGALVVHEQWRSRGELVRLDWGYGKGQGARLALLRRLAAPAARRRLKAELWDAGLVTAAHDLRRRYEFGALTTAVRTVATAIGYGYGTVMLRSEWIGEAT
jgi:GT2 family glycosyltransferase